MPVRKLIPQFPNPVDLPKHALPDDSSRERVHDLGRKVAERLERIEQLVQGPPAATLILAVAYPFADSANFSFY